MTGGAIHFHAGRLTTQYLSVTRSRPILRAEQVGGALVQGLSYIGVAAEAGLLNVDARQLPLLGLGVVDAVARQAAHVFTLVPPAAPVEKFVVAGVAFQTRLVGLQRLQLGRVDYVLRGHASDMLLTVAVARLARGLKRVLHEFGALAVSLRGEGFDDGLVASHAPRSDGSGLLCGLLRGGLLSGLSGGLCAGGGGGRL